MNLPSVLVVTRIPFWRLGAGERMRLLALLWVLRGKVRTTVLFLGPVGPGDLRRIEELRVGCELVALPAAADAAAELSAVQRLCAQRHFAVCIIERIQLDFLRAALPAGTRSVLDTHDLESDNAASRAASGIRVAGATSFADELEILAAYDRVLLIQADDYQRVRAQLGERALLVPHPVQFAQLPVAPAGKRLGLVASAWRANLDGLDWFADAVWPRLAIDAEMHLFGWISDGWRAQYAGFHRHGFVADFRSAWGSLDVAVNPVRWGSGLKIKSVEALGHGLPLVTTSEGARGMLDAAGEAFLLADAPDDFAAACRQLLADPGQRQALGDAAYAYARQHFSPQACFAEFVAWLRA